jgi:hypothetical protein
MSNLSDYLENKLIDHLFRAQTFSAPASLYVALFTATPTDSTAGTECAGTGYSRQLITSALTAWAATQSTNPTPNNSASSGTGGTTFNSTLNHLHQQCGCRVEHHQRLRHLRRADGRNELWYDGLL